MSMGLVNLKLECRWMQDSRAWPCLRNLPRPALPKEKVKWLSVAFRARIGEHQSFDDIGRWYRDKSSHFLHALVMLSAKVVATGDVSCQLLQLLSGWIGTISRVVDCRDLNPGGSQSRSDIVVTSSSYLQPLILKSAIAIHCLGQQAAHPLAGLGLRPLIIGCLGLAERETWFIFCIPLHPTGSSRPWKVEILHVRLVFPFWRLAMRYSKIWSDWAVQYKLQRFQYVPIPLMKW